MTQRRVAAKKTRARFGIFGEIIAELKKVTWLKWPNEVLYLSALVLIVTIIVAIFLGVIDYGFTRLINDIFAG